MGHRRLSILDLSQHGHQPMMSSSGRYVLVYNGEIYNHSFIRDRLISEGLAPTWQGHSDTEVLIAAIDAWGLEEALRNAVGMFAIALWDRKDRLLRLARDRVGEKPLYYGTIKGKFLFGSELKALKVIARDELQIDCMALSEFMRFSYIPAPKSIYSGIYKLLPGHILTVKSVSKVGYTLPYWSLVASKQEPTCETLLNRNDEEIIDLVHSQLSDSIGLQMVSDVPSGAFLSGGVDSSVVAALMQSRSMHRVRTYTIGFQNKLFDEAPYARAVAKHLGTEHSELYVTAKDAENVIRHLSMIYDEPFADSSQIPTILVSQLAREDVVVALSGDGGDEVFSGYERYQLVGSLWDRINQYPLSVRRLIAKPMRVLSPNAWDGVLGCFPSLKNGAVNGRRIHRLAQLLSTQSLGEMYIRLMSQWQLEDDVVLCMKKSSKTSLSWPLNCSNLDAMRIWDIGQYLPDDLMVKVDRASMSVGLESRAPFLDHRLVELALTLPQRMLIRDGVGKWVLRQILDNYVPRKLVERPKAGFSIPIADWLRGPLRDWAGMYLEKSKLSEHGFFDVEKIMLLWDQHLSMKYDRSAYLWNVLMFQAWYYENHQSSSISTS
jgi:asparagine synthase (glutamine-hydrolysing)